MKIKKLLKNTLILSFAFIFVFHSNELTSYAQEEPFDFSKTGSLDSISLPADQLLELITQDEILLEESNYLSKHGSPLKYEGKIPSSYMTTILHNDRLLIQARPYSYLDHLNRTIVWTPYQATIDNVSSLFEYKDTGYECVLENISQEDEIVNVTYTSNFNLKKEDVNTLINQSYNIAEYYVKNDVIHVENQKYEQAKQQYNQDMILYNQYCVDYAMYQQNLSQYNQYLKDKQTYDVAKRKYDQYLLEYEEYQQDLQRYNQYLTDKENYDQSIIAYQNYLNDKARYEKEHETYLKDYQTYEGFMEKVSYQLSAMELIQTSMTSLNRSVYNAVMGNSVTTVLERKEELEQLNANPAVIDDAESATIALKEIFKTYFSLQTEKEKYTYYKANYRSIKSNLEKLLRSLEKLYRSGWVDSALDQLGKTEKYLILIAQLAVVCNAIDDKPVYNYEGNLNPNNEKAAIFDSSWKIENKTILEILENDVNFIDKDGYSYPVVVGYPEKPIEPVAPQEVLLPTLPEEVARPIEPIEVANPGNPFEEVMEPVCPTEVSLPIEPIPFVVEPEILDLIDAYQQQKLAKREEYSGDVSITLSSNVDKKFRNSSVVTINFYDENEQFLSRYETELGSYIVYEDALPVKEADEKYSQYEFSHWAYEDGEPLDLSNVVKGGNVFPVFNGIVLRQYEVIWIVDGNEEKEYYPYGALPEYSKDIKKKYEGNSYYSFQSWDKEIDHVTANITYQAIFEEKYIIEKSNQHAEINVLQDKIIVDCTSFDTLQSINLYHFLEEVIDESNEVTVEIVHKDIKLIFDYLTLQQMKIEKHTILNAFYEDKGFGEYYFSVDLNDEKGNPSNLYAILVNINGQFDISHSNLYSYDEESNETQERFTFKNNQLICTLETAKRYHLYPLYTVFLSNNENVEISLSSNQSQYKHNESVNFQTKILKEGMQIDEITIRGSSGEMIRYQNNCFTMPAMDVYVTLSCSSIKYVVNFISDGEVIYSKTYSYGETIEFPTNPIKAGDEKYAYQFIKWDKDTTIVTENIDFVAVFEKTDNPYRGIEHKKSIIKIIKIVAISLFAIGAIIIVLLVLKKKNILFKK